MASRYLVTGGATTAWSDTSNWSATDGGASGAAAPTASDDVFINSNSGNAPIALTSGVCLTFAVSGTYTGTISGSGSFTLSGSCTLITGINFTATSTFNFNATATITTAGKTLGALTLQTNSTTYTFADDCNVSGTYLNSGNNLVLLGQTIYVGGNFTWSNGTTTSSTTKFVLNGTTTWSGAGACSNDVEIAGNVTFAAATLIYRTGTLKYTSGTVITTGNTLSITGSCTFDTDRGGTQIDWNNVSVAGVTITNNSILNVGGTLTITSSIGIINGSDVYIKGDFTQTTNTGTGSSLFLFNGTGSQLWTGTSTFQVRQNVTIDKPSGTLTLSANICFAAITFIHLNGTVDAATNSNTITIPVSGAVTFNTSTTTLNNISLTNSGSNILLLSDLNLGGTLTNASNAQQINGNYTVNLKSYSYTTAGALTSTSSPQSRINFNVNGGTWTHASTGVLNLDTTISADITISGTVYYATRTLTYSSGVVTTTGSTIVLSSSPTLTTNGITWNNITSTATTITLGSNLNYSTSGTLTLPNNTFTFAGNFDVTGGTLTNSALTVNRTYTFRISRTYTFNNITLSGATVGRELTLVSSTASTAANIVLTSGTGTQKVFLVRATDINSSGGEPIRSVGIRPQDLTRTTNWTNNSGQFFNFFK